MDFTIDAWLERRDPCIVVRHGVTQSPLLEWDHAMVKRLFASGEVAPEDFLDLAARDVTEMVLTLFRLAGRLEARGVAEAC